MDHDRSKEKAILGRLANQLAEAEMAVSNQIEQLMQVDKVLKHLVNVTIDGYFWDESDGSFGIRPPAGDRQAPGIGGTSS